ncbi:MAG: hypothetical protein A6F72_03490 [Cycloclasticus sp. symbiont of Poecilosclerida sp. N]|nr:MAG: hypothetical protein A6F72_03490 [Cycloclasticus sp. symbiont of Poecilosclerida sp. N]
MQENSTQEILRQLGNRISVRRLKENISQSTLASKSGCSLSTIKNVEQGKNISLSSLIGFLRVFHSLDDLESILKDDGLTPMQKLEQQKKKLRVTRKRASKSP